MKDNLYKYVGWLIAVTLLFLTIFLYIENNRANSLISDYKDTIIETDSLRKIKEGIYEKLVDDRLTSRELLKKLKSDNLELYKLIKEQNKNPISYTNISMKPNNKQTTTTITTENRDGVLTSSFVDYYPNKDDYFIKYSGLLKKDSLKGNFEFTNLDIDILISEKQKGIFEADLKAPQWLKVSKIEVSSLPIEPVTEKRNNLLLGVSTGLMIGSYNPVFEAKVGYSSKKNIWLLEGNTNREVKLGLLKKF